ncbi:hypothetical protein JM654_23485 [Microbacterium oxydans]|nr:hypothetical protein [Microbacterium oxydans]
MIESPSSSTKPSVSPEATVQSVSASMLEANHPPGRRDAPLARRTTVDMDEGRRPARVPSRARRPITVLSVPSGSAGHGDAAAAERGRQSRAPRIEGRPRLEAFAA